MRSKIPSSLPKNSVENCDIAKLTHFRPATTEEIKSIVSSFPIKCSPLDPIPANLLKNHTVHFIEIWTQLVNLSFEYGTMDGLKHSAISPLLKDICS